MRITWKMESSVSELWTIVPGVVSALSVLFLAGQYFAERKRRADESERESRSQAVRLSAWTAADFERQIHGVVIKNDSGTTFHDLHVDAEIHGKRPRPISLWVLPPGEYFVPLTQDGADLSWGYPIRSDEHFGKLRAHTVSKSRYGVREIMFVDCVGQRWKADKHMLLQRSSA